MAAHDGEQQRPTDPAASHYYGGQAVIEGVMMRGADTWAVAVRRPAGDIYIERRAVSTAPTRYPILKRPMFRGVFALFDAMAIGVKALGISATQALPEEEEPLDGKALGGTMVVALLFFIGVFIVLPNVFLASLRGWLGDGLLYHTVEGLLRIAIFLAYLSAISLMADIRRVFQYHGAEHKTIAAWEHGERLEPETVDRYSTLHVRCGTNFLIIVMLLALLVYSVAGVLVPPPEGIGWVGAVVYHVTLRIVLLPVVAGLAYEGIRLGAAHGDAWWVNALMQPGLWLQKITTRPPTEDMIEVAIRAFESVVPAADLDGRTTDLPSGVLMGEDEGAPRASLITRTEGA
ncbi:MAG: DUF1385 domain-containing protein [Actinobacteria bacterium]|nr:DUF1385 domain-containing protein [Actinomycetota bacterium]